MKRRLKKKMKKNCASWEKKRGKRLTEKIHSSIREQNPEKKIYISVNETVQFIEFFTNDRLTEIYKILRFIFSMISGREIQGFRQTEVYQKKIRVYKTWFHIFSLLIFGTHKKILKKEE